jgi:hypothetical protein
MRLYKDYFDPINPVFKEKVRFLKRRYFVDMSKETPRLDYNGGPGFILVFPEIRNIGLTQGPGLRGDCRD